MIDLTKHNYVLTRVKDNKQIPCTVVKFIEWNEDGTFKFAHDDPSPGRSIVLDPGPHGMYSWLTSRITEIVSKTEFKTANSIYYLHSV